MIRAILLVAALAACGGGPSPAPVGPATPAAVHDDPTCPLVVPGTSVTVEDTAQGAALVFVTTGDAAAVRARAAALAKAHNGRAAGSPAGHSMGEMIGVASTAETSDVPGGARVAFATTDAAQVGALQSELRGHAHHLTGNSCEM